MNNAGITVAELPDLLNMPPQHGCARRLYFQKIGELPVDPCSIDDEPAIKSRNVIYKDYVSKIYTKKTKRRIRGPNQIFTNQRYPFILGDCDLLQTNMRDGYGNYVPLEIRAVNRVQYYRIRKEGLLDRYYSYQMAHLMIAKKATWSSLIIFCPDVMEMKHFDFKYDETIAAEVINAERAFWETTQEKPKLPYWNPEQKCKLCGYRHKCGFDISHTELQKEDLELTVTVNQINTYLRGE